MQSLHGRDGKIHDEFLVPLQLDQCLAEGDQGLVRQTRHLLLRHLVVEFPREQKRVADVFVGGPGALDETRGEGEGEGEG